MAIKCGKCGNDMSEGTEQCEMCGSFSRTPTTLEKDARAQVLATLVQSQDNITWLAFSLAMTIEVLLLATFAQIDSQGYGRGTLFIAGVLIGFGFWFIVHRSNVDMSNLYYRAARDYQDTFHFLNAERFPKTEYLRFATKRIIDIAFVALLVGWIIVFCLNAAGMYD